jgi:MYXO-CTERM domain-containing protein
MRTCLLLLASAFACACVEAPPEVSTQTAALVECNLATLGQPCDTDDEECTREMCEMVGDEATGVSRGPHHGGRACESDGDDCTVDTCQAGVCVHDDAPWCAPDAGLDEPTVTEMPPLPSDRDPQGYGDPQPGPDDVSIGPDGGVEPAAPDAAPEPRDPFAFEGDIGGGGLGCAAADPDPDAAVSILVVGLILLGRRRHAVAAAVLATGIVAGAAHAQVDASAYKPASPGAGGFAVERAAALPAGALDVGVWFDVARDLLVVRDPDTGEVLEHGVLVGERSTMHIAASIGLAYGLELGAQLPLVVDQSGDLAMVGGGALPARASGDLALRAKWSLGRGLALAATLDAPLGDPGTFSHDRGVGAGARLLTGTTLGRTDLSLAVGRRWRERAMIGNLVVDDEWVAEAGAQHPVIDRRLWLVADGYVAVATEDPAQRQVPAELLGGVRARVAGPWIAQVGVGAGLTHGYGTPSVRGVALLAWSPERAPKRPRLRELAPPPPAPRAIARPEPPARDRDPLAERDERCVECARPDPTPPELVIERIVLEDRVLFDTDRARVKTAARKVLARVVADWASHPEWDRIVLEGHTDERGGDEYNDWLGLERATRVHDVLVAAGAPADRIDVVSYGKSRPLSDDLNENRRVELVILRRPAE